MLSSVIQGAGRPFTASIGQAVEFVVLAGLLVALVPRMGVVGGALSVVLGAAVSFIVLLVAALFVGRLTPGRLVMVWISQIRRWRQRHSTSQRGRRAGVRDP
jgi:O-antigen/teichoic acid export membrane protein